MFGTGRTFLSCRSLKIYLASQCVFLDSFSTPGPLFRLYSVRWPLHFCNCRPTWRRKMTAHKAGCCGRAFYCPYVVVTHSLPTAQKSNYAGQRLSRTSVAKPPSPEVSPLSSWSSSLLLHISPVNLPSSPSLPFGPPRGIPLEQEEEESAAIGDGGNGGGHRCFVAVLAPPRNETLTERTTHADAAFCLPSFPL